MPLPKPPGKPATLLDLSSAVEARAKRPPAPRLPKPGRAAAPEVVPMSAARGAGARPARAEAPAKPARPAQAPSPVVREPRRDAARRPKIFVLDTNVLMHDPSSLFRFAEHDIYLPMMTLEELDNHKKGMSEVARSARQVSRSLDALIAAGGDIEEGLVLSALGNRDAQGRLFFQTQAIAPMLPSTLPMGKADNQILGVVRAMQDQVPDRQVVLVSKDINMRIKARTMGLPAEDYFNDQVLEDTDLLYTGVLQLPDDFWEKHGKGVESWQQGGHTFYRISGPLVSSLVLNQFVYSEGEMPLVAQVREIAGRTAVLETLRDYGHHKNAVWGITARNREQNFALNLLMNPEIDFVSLLGQAGTGKTLLTLAAGLVQVLETRRFTEIIMTRATVPVGEDIGYLPGTEEEKMQPWMGALEDNLEVLDQSDPSAGEWGRAAAIDLIRGRVKVKALSFMRGRTFSNKFLIIDEAQNLTPKQMKTLVTRAGPGTKVVCLGNIAQIDTPYLTEGSSGLTYVVDRFKGWAHAGHVALQRGERSRLADYATDAL
ncbi:MAG: PhoH family protein [Lautropia sp.]|nr:PhoH family protein [Lautropia sp.]MCL4701206.1 PhoH family protein [Burkholderiaceae bacterium]MCZ2413680.1 PhoH family protein [Burkholderiales bacterium]MDL1907638.1 PhoH family protein [Betaproteobacteria bacterium PRO1]RIK86346.1 MAG: ribonuclease [Burkholderiales bacterium]